MHGSYFEDYVTTAIKDRYNLICSIESHVRMNPTGNYYASSGDGRPLPHESSLYSLVFLGLTLNSIDSWMQSFKTNSLQQTTMYGDKMSEFFKKIHVTIIEHKPG